MRSAAFRQWLATAKWQKEMRARLRKAIGRMRSVVVASCFRGWAYYSKNVRRTAAATEIEALTVTSPDLLRASTALIPFGCAPWAVRERLPGVAACA